MLVRRKARNGVQTGGPGEQKALTSTVHDKAALPAADISPCIDQDQEMTAKSLGQGDARGSRRSAEKAASSKEVVKSTYTLEDLDTRREVEGPAPGNPFEGNGAQPEDSNETVEARVRERWSQQMRELAATVDKEAEGWQRYARAAGAAEVGNHIGPGGRGREPTRLKQEATGAPAAAAVKRSKVLRQGPRQSWKRREALQAAEEEPPREEPRGTQKRRGTGRKSVQRQAAGGRGRKRTVNEAEIGKTNEVSSLSSNILDRHNRLLSRQSFRSSV